MKSGKALFKEENAYEKILPIILILLGAAEIVIALADIKMPVIIAVVLGVAFIALGVKTLVDACKKK